VDRAAFERALAAGTIADTLNEYPVTAGDFFLLEARTVHAIGAGCLLYEIQQTSDVTFRVDDWGRVGLDGKPRPLHVRESLDTIDFSRSGFGPQRPAWRAHPEGGEARTLVDGAYFAVEEWRGLRRISPATDRCAIVIALESSDAGDHLPTLATAGGSVVLPPMTTALVPAAAGGFTVEAPAVARLLIARPKL
jgi:mannose-6-phosphate isomerase